MWSHSERLKSALPCIYSCCCKEEKMFRPAISTLHQFQHLSSYFAIKWNPSVTIMKEAAWINLYFAQIRRNNSQSLSSRQLPLHQRFLSFCLELDICAGTSLLPQQRKDRIGKLEDKQQKPTKDIFISVTKRVDEQECHDLSRRLKAEWMKFTSFAWLICLKWWRHLSISCKWWVAVQKEQT